jgi:RNA polymerase sigma-70 factor (ECF subfamily)
MNEISWENLVKRYQRHVFSVAFSVVRNVEDAEEITQEVFMKLHAHMGTIRDRKAIPAWLAKTSYRIAINKLIASKVKKWTMGTEEAESCPSQSRSPEDEMGVSEELRKVRMWRKARLSRKENVVLQLKLGQEMTFQEIADFLGMSISSVKTHYYRAARKMESLTQE